MDDETDMMIMEVRSEIMQNPGQMQETSQPAHFLNPSIPVSDPLVSDFRPASELIKVSYPGWNNPLKKWKVWVEQMKTLHQSTWKKAGIYEAIIASTYKVKPNTNHILALTERWSHKTNSFMFPWGEGTITLEDVLVLGGFSVLGEPVRFQMNSVEFNSIEVEFQKVRNFLNTTTAKRVGHTGWLDFFMGSGTNVEQEAFLVLWLSRHVFPFAKDIVGKQFHRMAIQLARGTRLALAPAILAFIYRDLSRLKRHILHFSEEIKDKLVLWSRMHFVQVWGWERLPLLRPPPNYEMEGEPRMARWDNLVKLSPNIESVRMAINIASENFLWRPYTDSVNFNFYPTYKIAVWVGSAMNEDFATYAKIVRVTLLAGSNFVESYLPHRVSRQFGLAQDIPGEVNHLEVSPERAWENYSRPIRDRILYIPSRTSRSGVTCKYDDWQRQSSLEPQTSVEMMLLMPPQHNEEAEAVEAMVIPEVMPYNIQAAPPQQAGSTSSIVPSLEIDAPDGATGDQNYVEIRVMETETAVAGQERNTTSRVFGGGMNIGVSDAVSVFETEAVMPPNTQAAFPQEGGSTSSIVPSLETIVEGTKEDPPIETLELSLSEIIARNAEAQSKRLAEEIRVRKRKRDAIDARDKKNIEAMVRAKMEGEIEKLRADRDAAHNAMNDVMEDNKKLVEENKKLEAELNLVRAKYS